MLASIPAAGMYSRATTSGTAAENDGAFTAQARPSRNVSTSSRPALEHVGDARDGEHDADDDGTGVGHDEHHRAATRGRRSTPDGMVNTRNGSVTADCTSATTSVDSPRCTMTTWAATVSTQIAVWVAS